MKISFYTTCMDRLFHLKETLPRNLAVIGDYDVEFVVLNYNSKDELNDWMLETYKTEITNELIKLFHTKEPKYFNMSHAKNSTAKLCSGEILVCLDADNVILDNFVGWILENFTEPDRVVAQSDPQYVGMSGRIVISKKNFMKLKGYDENFKIWGYEDMDFIERALNLGLDYKLIDKKYSSIIDHDNKLRFENYPSSLYEKFISPKFLEKDFPDDLIGNKDYHSFDYYDNKGKNVSDIFGECKIERII